MPTDRRWPEPVWTALTGAALVLILACSAWLRAPGFEQGGFASHDVAGILYNAMVLERGGLPYVDTLELKAPGSFYLARAFAGPEARDIARFQIAANLWALLSLVCVAGLGWRLWGRLGAVVAAGSYALLDANLDSMDANYVTWANLPQIVGVWLALEAGRAESARWRPMLWLLAGAAAGFATLCKQPNGVVLIVILAIAATSSVTSSLTSSVTAEAQAQGVRPSLVDRLRASASASAPAWVALGFGLAHAPIVAQYLAAGRLGALIDGYFLSRWGLRYLGAREVSLGAELVEGALASAHFLGLGLVFASFSVGLALTAHPERETRVERRQVACLAGWLAATLLAASLGFRFYKGYFLAAAAPACLLAAAPSGLLGARFRGPWPARVAGLALALILALRSALILAEVRQDRGLAHDLGGRRIAEHIVAHTDPDDTIWVWGWHLWDVYPLANRMAGTRIYKSLGILSQPNDDSWRRPATPLRFVESEHSRALLDELERSRPAYIVLGSTVPHREFTALHEFLRAHYRRDFRVRLGRVQFWRRVD
jgi:hypothetical protein